MSAPATPQAKFGRLIVPLGAAGAICLIGAAILGRWNPDEGFRSYLFAYVYWFVIPLGCLCILMLHHLVGGWWGLPIRRLAEAGTRTLPLTALTFIPVLLGMNRLYSWLYDRGQFNTTDNDKINYAFKLQYLTHNGFIGRAIVYFAIWIALMVLFNMFSSHQDQSGADGTKFALRMEGLAGPGIILTVFAITFASVDWVMSLEPKWFSTMFGFIITVVGLLTAMSLMVTVLSRIADDEPIVYIGTPQLFNDLGNLLLAFTMLWAYMSFSQLLIIWAGNMKDEIPWYMSRAFGSWGALAAILIVFHFAVPFLVLLQRMVKRNLRRLRYLTIWMMFISALDVYWLVMPSFYPQGIHFAITDVLAFVGLGGLWLAFFFYQYGRMPVLPLNDPRFEGALAHEHGD
jgi:hypothetical protein